MLFRSSTLTGEYQFYALLNEEHHLARIFLVNARRKLYFY